MTSAAEDDLAAHVARVVDDAPPLSESQLEHLGAILRAAPIRNATRPPATNEGPLDREPCRAPLTTGESTPGAEVGRAA